MLYRGTLAERRRLHSEAPWQLTGVVVGGTWYPAAQGIGPAPVRAITAGLVEVVPLPPFLAPDDGAAVGVALEEAARAGYATGRWVEGPAGPGWVAITDDTAG